jgi:hypothetical protein
MSTSMSDDSSGAPSGREKIEASWDTFTRWSYGLLVAFLSSAALASHQVLPRDAPLGVKLAFIGLFVAIAGIVAAVHWNYIVHLVRAMAIPPQPMWRMLVRTPPGRAWLLRAPLFVVLAVGGAVAIADIAL